MFRFFSGRGAQEAASDAGTTAKDAGGNKEHAAEQRTEEDKAVTSHIQKMDNIIRRKLHVTGAQYNMKVVIRGDRGVGKSTLWRRLQGLPYEEKYTPTPEIQTTTINNWAYRGSQDVVKVEVWDVVDRGLARRGVDIAPEGGSLEDAIAGLPADSGSARGGLSLAVLDASVVNVYQGANAVILMVDPYRPETLDKVEKALTEAPVELPAVVLLNFRDKLEEDAAAKASQKHATPTPPPATATPPKTNPSSSPKDAAANEGSGSLPEGVAGGGEKGDAAEATGNKIGKTGAWGHVVTLETASLMMGRVREADEREGRGGGRRVSLFDCSMKNCFGLRVLYTYLNVPYLELKRRSLLQQAQMAAERLETEYRELQGFIGGHSYGNYVRHLQSSDVDPTAGRSTPAAPPGRPSISSLPTPVAVDEASLERRGSVDSYGRESTAGGKGGKEKKKKHHKDKDKDKSKKKDRHRHKGSKGSKDDKDARPAYEGRVTDAKEFAPVTKKSATEELDDFFGASSADDSDVGGRERRKVMRAVDPSALAKAAPSGQRTDSDEMPARRTSRLKRVTLPVKPIVDATPATTVAPVALSPALQSAAPKPVPAEPPAAPRGDGHNASLTENPRPSGGRPDDERLPAGSASPDSNSGRRREDGSLDDVDGAVSVDSGNLQAPDGGRGGGGRQEEEGEDSLAGGGGGGGSLDRGEHEDDDRREGGGRCIDDDKASAASVTPQAVTVTGEEKEAFGQEGEVRGAAGGEVDRTGKDQGEQDAMATGGSPRSQSGVDHPRPEYLDAVPHSPTEGVADASAVEIAEADSRHDARDTKGEAASEEAVSSPRMRGAIPGTTTASEEAIPTPGMNALTIPTPGMDDSIPGITAASSDVEAEVMSAPPGADSRRRADATGVDATGDGHGSAGEKIRADGSRDEAVTEGFEGGKDDQPVVDEVVGAKKGAGAGSGTERGAGVGDSDALDAEVEVDGSTIVPSGVGSGDDNIASFRPGVTREAGGGDGGGVAGDFFAGGSSSSSGGEDEPYPGAAGKSTGAMEKVDHDDDEDEERLEKLGAIAEEGAQPPPPRFIASSFSRVSHAEERRLGYSRPSSEAIQVGSNRGGGGGRGGDGLSEAAKAAVAAALANAASAGRGGGGGGATVRSSSSRKEEGSRSRKKKKSPKERRRKGSDGGSDEEDGAEAGRGGGDRGSSGRAGQDGGGRERRSEKGEGSSRRHRRKSAV